jgi:2-phosphosulfolactate phosphatase
VRRVKIWFYPILTEIEKEVLHGAAVAVIDVLRSSSTILAALCSGAKKIIPVNDIETASRLVRPSERGLKLLAGERKGLPIEGFDLFNSPLEFTPDRVRGKTIVLSTSNGTKAVTAASTAKRVVICAINNVGAAADALRRESRLVIICSGNSGELAGEDLLCGGMLLARLGESGKSGGLSDAARLALFLAESVGNDVEDFLRSCDRGRELMANGYEEDIAYCALRDNINRVPELRQGAIM